VRDSVTLPEMKLQGCMPKTVTVPQMNFKVVFLKP
jgi:hypothetical protein